MFLKIGTTPQLAQVLHNLPLTDLAQTELAGINAAVIADTDAANINQLAESPLPIPVFILGQQAPPSLPGAILLPAITDAAIAQIKAAALQYEQRQIPPYVADLLDFAQADPTTFATPGHHAGHYDELAPAGWLLKQAYGQTFFSSDTSDVVTALGDMLTHGGTPLTAEQAAAKLWHADKTYFVTNGTTGSNNIVASAILQPGDLVLFDRNNHKSVYNGALVMNGAIPVYLDTLRSDLGLIGPIDLKDGTEEKLRNYLRTFAPKQADQPRPFRLAALELETFDGIVPDVKMLLDRFGKLVDYMLFDAAWGGYEPFIPAMRPMDPLQLPLGPDDPGIIVTQSVHKQQSGFAQTSQIHKKDSHLKGQARYVSHAQFNHAYLKHVTTSYSYPLYASLAANVALNEGTVGQKIWRQALADSLAFRRALDDTQLFRAYNSPELITAETDTAYTDPQAWALAPQAKWHGIPDLLPGQAYLDPGKVTVVLPHDRQLGVSGWVVDRYLLDHNIVPEKADFNSLLFLVTPGSRMTDWRRLLDVLKQFETDFFNDKTVAETLPKLVAETGDRYAHMTLRELCQQLSDFFKDEQLVTRQRWLFQNSNNRDQVMSAAQADTLFATGRYETVPLTQSAGRVAVEGALPYPPGIFVVVPGETWTLPAIDYFRSLFAGIARFPGFTPEIQGVFADDDGDAMVHVAK